MSYSSTENVKRIHKVLDTTASVNGGDNEVFRVFELALCGHMTLEQQASFLEDAKNRGLLNENGELIVG